MTLQEWLKTQDRSKYRAAKDLGVAWTTLWRWITGRAMPKHEQMRAVQTYTGGAVTPNDWINTAAKPAVITGGKK